MTDEEKWEQAIKEILEALTHIGDLGDPVPVVREGSRGYVPYKDKVSITINYHEYDEGGGDESVFH